MRPRALLLMHKLINSAQRRPSTKIHDQKRLHFLVTNLKFLKGAQCFATGSINHNKLHLVIVTWVKKLSHSGREQTKKFKFRNFCLIRLGNPDRNAKSSINLLRESSKTTEITYSGRARGRREERAPTPTKLEIFPMHGLHREHSKDIFRPHSWAKLRKMNLLFMFPHFLKKTNCIATMSFAQWVRHIGNTHSSYRYNLYHDAFAYLPLLLLPIVCRRQPLYFPSVSSR